MSIKNILVVDNNPAVTLFMEELLTKENYVVETASTGLEALHRLTDYTPDIIFVDLVMPEIDGEHLCRLLKKREALKDTAIVILSAIAAEDRGRSFSVFADACIAKMPFKKMKSYILTLLSDFDRGETLKYRETIVGTGELFSREITRELLYAKMHMDTIFSSITDGYLELTPDYIIIEANCSAETMTRISVDTLLGTNFLELFEPPIRTIIESVLRAADSEPQIVGEKEDIPLDDRLVSLQCVPIAFQQYRSILVIMKDITERKEAERIIKKSLKEKEILLKEVHHRVKNNLQIVASLLNLQLPDIPDEKSAKLINESQNRIITMALVHESLYDTQDYVEVNVREYLERLLSHVYRTSCSQYDIRVQYSLDAPDISIPLGSAISLGLIVNELFTNALVHGIKEMDEGNITVRIVKDDDMRFTLVVKDNGVGIPEDIDIHSGNSLGMLLVSNLSEQLDGSFSIVREQGTKAVVTFHLSRSRD